MATIKTIDFSTKPICPECGREIPTDEIDVEKDRAWCPNCRREWGGDKFTEERRFEDYAADGCRIEYVVTESHDCGVVTNAWGIGDWCWQEKLLDAIDARLVPHGHSGEKGVFQTQQLPPPTTLEDPVHVCTNEHAGTLTRMPAWARWKVAMRDFEKDWGPLRFVIAPAIPGF